MSDTTLNLTPKVYDYLLNVSLREPTVLKNLRTETHKLSNAIMQISPEQGQFMSLLVELINAKKTLDIGTFTGYSALAVALTLPANGKVIACDVSTEWTDIAKQFWAAAGVSNKIDLRIGPAIDTLQNLIDNGESNTFDFAFIDADKVNYEQYYQKAFTLLRQGGLIAIDNVLFFGKVADEKENDENTMAIRALNTKLLNDNRVTISMLSIGDGLTLARKK